MALPGQISTASFSQYFHPGGIQLTASQVLPSNFNRMELEVFNSGNQGPAFLFFGFAGTRDKMGCIEVNPMSHVDFDPRIYTGPVFAIWGNSGTVSASYLAITEFQT